MPARHPRFNHEGMYSAKRRGVFTVCKCHNCGAEWYTHEPIPECDLKKVLVKLKDRRASILKELEVIDEMIIDIMGG